MMYYAPRTHPAFHRNSITSNSMLDTNAQQVGRGKDDQANHERHWKWREEGEQERGGGEGAGAGTGQGAGAGAGATTRAGEREGGRGRSGSMKRIVYHAREREQ
eukprot:747979-Hanusia_phi.AAC.6